MPVLSFRIKTAAIILALAVVATPLASCGVKPKAVSPPPGEAAQHFPRTYPAPE